MTCYRVFALINELTLGRFAVHVRRETHLDAQRSSGPHPEWIALKLGISRAQRADLYVALVRRKKKEKK